MSLKERIAARLKAKAAGEKANLSQKRIDAIVIRAEKGLTDESDDTLIDANLDAINELTPFTEMAQLDDHERGKAAKIAADKEIARKKAIEDGKPEPVEIDPNETKTDKMLRLMMEKLEKQDAAIAAMAGEKVTNTRSQIAAEKLKDAPEWFRNDVLEDLKDRQFTDEDQYNSFLDRKIKGLENIHKSEDAENGIGAAFRPTGSAGGNTGKSVKEASAAEVDAAVNSII